MWFGETLTANVCNEAGLLKAVRAIDDASLQKQFPKTP